MQYSSAKRDFVVSICDARERSEQKQRERGSTNLFCRSLGTFPSRFRSWRDDPFLLHERLRRALSVIEISERSFGSFEILGNFGIPAERRQDIPVACISGREAV